MRSASAGVGGSTILLWALLLTGSAHALTPQEAGQPAPLKLSAHLVQIAVQARDSRGAVSGLTREDFSVFDRGTPRKISVFSADVAAPPRVPGLPPNTFSDRAPDGSGESRPVTIVLLDKLNTLSSGAPQPYEDAPNFVEEHALASGKEHLLQALRKLDPHDRIAVYALGHTLQVLCDFTCDREQLLTAVRRFDATSITPRELAQPGDYHLPNLAGEEFNQAIDAETRQTAAFANQSRGDATMTVLRVIAAHVAAIPGRKNLLWLTANLPFSGEAIARVLAPANIAAYPVDVRGLLPESILSPSSEGSMHRPGLGVSAAPSNTSQPVGLDAMQAVAEDTGGHAFINSNDVTGAITEILDKPAVTYTIGFYVDAAAVDGQFHKLRVEVRGTGLTLHYPKGYFALPDAPSANEKSQRNRNALAAALASPFESPGILLQAKLSRSTLPASHAVEIQGSIGLGDLHLDRQGDLRKGTVNVYTVEQDLSGVVVGRSNHPLILQLTEAQYQECLRSGVLFQQRIELKENAAVLRVMVQDPASSAVGSLIVPAASIR